MAKTFDPSKLSPTDQAAWNGWRQKAQRYLQGGALPAEISYVLEHPDYLRTHPQLQDAYNTLTGANLPPSVKSAVQQQLGGTTNFDWSGGQAGIGKHGGWWSQPESWVQLGLGAGFGAAAPAALGSAGVTAGGAGSASGAAGAVGAAGAAGAAGGGTAGLVLPLVSAGVGAFGTWYAAHKQGQAIDTASETQQAAAQQAIALQQQAQRRAEAAIAPAMSMFGPGAPGSGATTGAPVGPLGVPQGQFGTLGDVYGKILQAQLTNLGPYTSLGGGAAGALGFGLGLPGFQGGIAPMAAPMSAAPASSALTTPAIVTGPTTSNGGPPHPEGTLGFDWTTPGGPPGGIIPPSEVAAGQPTTSGQVPMRAPDGSIKSVPASQVAYYKGQGATLVGSTL